MIVVNENFGDILLLKQIFASEYPKLYQKAVFAKTHDELEKYIKEASVYLTFTVDQSIIDKAKRLKLIQVPIVGVNQISKSINTHGAVICNVHGNSLATAEHAIALMLSAAKDIVANHIELTHGIWHNILTDKRKTIQISGKSAGILGFGAIGKHIARLCKCMGMKVNVLKRTSAITETVNYVDKIFTNDDINGLIDISDFIIIALPLTNKTRAMIGKDELSRMKGKIIVNIARGHIIDEEALFYALKNDILKSAGIDVWYNYPNANHQICLPSDFPFYQLENVVISPHCAGLTAEGMSECYCQAFDNIKNLYGGRALQNIVDFEEWY